MVRARDVSDSPQQGVFRGFIRSTYDALLVFEAALSGRIPRVTRRFTDNEKRNDIRSGHCFVFGEEEAEIKRWTDGITWSPSRINKNFLIYRERYAADEPRPDNLPRRDYENWLVGTLNTPEIKQDGLVKKTICLSIDGLNYHLVSYYYPQEVLTGQLQRPSRLPQFKDVQIRDSILDCRMLREPLKSEIDSDGNRVPIPDEDGSGPVSQQVTPPPDSPRSHSNPHSRASPSPPRLHPGPEFFALAVPQAEDVSLAGHSPDGGFFNVNDLPSPLPPFHAQEPALNSLEFFPDGFGNVSVVPASGSPLGRRRSTRTASSSRWAPYALRTRASAPETGMISHAQLPQQQQQQQQQHADSSPSYSQQPQPQQQQSSPIQHQPQHLQLQTPALVRTRSAPTPLELIPPPLLPVSVYGSEPLSATLSEFEDAYYYGPITPQSVGGFDYFELNPGQGEAGKFSQEHDALVLDDMSQYLVQSAWGSEMA